MRGKSNSFVVGGTTNNNNNNEIDIEIEEEPGEEDAFNLRRMEEKSNNYSVDKLEDNNGENNNNNNNKIGVTRYRWVILAIFSIENLVNSTTWICFAPIQTTITEYYRVSTTIANLLTLMFLICSLPTTIAAMYLQERFGLRIMVILGSVIQAVGCWVRFAGQGRDHFGVCLLGSIIAGPSMAVFMCLPSKLAALWFPESERTIATTIASLTGVLGVLAGYVIGPAVISELDDVPTFLLIQAIIPTVSCVLVVFFRHSPPLPASLSETIVKIPLRDSLRVAFSNKSFVIILIGFTFGLGCFNALSTLIDQIVNPLKYSADDSSLFGGLLIGLGLVGAGILGFYVEKTHKYKVGMMISIWGCFFCVLWMVLALSPNNTKSLAAAFAFVGIFGLALLPLTLECGCEVIFPVPEVVTNGLLMVFGQTFGVVIVFVMDAMKDHETKSMKNACWLLLALVGVSAMCMSTFYPDYKRISHDMNNNKETNENNNGEEMELNVDSPQRWWRLFY